MLAAKLARNDGILCKLRHFLLSYILRTLYCSLILPHLQHCTLIWANTYFSKLNKIRVLQKKTIRIMSNSDYFAHTDPLLTMNKLLKLDDVDNLQSGLIMYEHTFYSLPNNIAILFSKRCDIHNYNTSAYFIHESRTNLRKFTINYSGPLFWNSIPAHKKCLYQYTNLKAACTLLQLVIH